mgnify:CR=1 FL=1
MHPPSPSSRGSEAERGFVRSRCAVRVSSATNHHHQPASLWTHSESVRFVSNHVAPLRCCDPFLFLNLTLWPPFSYHQNLHCFQSSGVGFTSRRVGPRDSSATEHGGSARPQVLHPSRVDSCGSPAASRAQSVRALRPRRTRVVWFCSMPLSTVTRHDTLSSITAPMPSPGTLFRGETADRVYTECMQYNLPLFSTQHWRPSHHTG